MNTEIELTTVATGCPYPVHFVCSYIVETLYRNCLCLNDLVLGTVNISRWKKYIRCL